MKQTPNYGVIHVGICTQVGRVSSVGTNRAESTQTSCPAPSHTSEKEVGNERRISHAVGICMCSRCPSLQDAAASITTGSSHDETVPADLSGGAEPVGDGLCHRTKGRSRLGRSPDGGRVESPKIWDLSKLLAFDILDGKLYAA